MDRLRHAAARGSKLLDELTSFSSITSEDESPTVFNLSHLVHDVIFELRNRIDQTHGEIKSGDLPEICGNPRYIRSLFYHLISNALKFCKTDTPPRISISSQRTEDHQWQIFVKDNGLGIEKKYLEKIFKPFEKLNPKDGYGGMGMGLTICRKIAENHSGTIVAQSNPEEGTVFILTLPEIRRN